MVKYQRTEEEAILIKAAKYFAYILADDPKPVENFQEKFKKVKPFVTSKENGNPFPNRIEISLSEPINPRTFETCKSVVDAVNKDVEAYKKEKGDLEHKEGIKIGMQINKVTIAFPADRIKPYLFRTIDMAKKDARGKYELSQKAFSGNGIEKQ